MSIIQVGLVDTTGKLDPELVQNVAAALNIQVMRDLPQFWDVKATVMYLPNPKKIPAGVWPIRLVPSLPPGEGGVHKDKNHQPYSLVIATPASDEWTIDASHECIEMLVDPYANRLQTSRAITIAGNGVKDTNGEFSYLVEACDPCEGDDFAYQIQGVAVSDFITPHFYDPVVTAGTRYSFTGAIKAPRQLLKAGYISYINLQTNEVEQILWVNPGPPVNKVLGAVPPGLSIRVWVDSKVAEYKDATKHDRKLNKVLLSDCKKHRANLTEIASLRASQFKY
ncbi:MAG TPA: hypothetical protein VG347_24595 [Verrucomicrobiae bacterium]|nr:hypothetical protein [Verrucomicrobiae bacterium]